MIDRRNFIFRRIIAVLVMALMLAGTGCVMAFADDEYDDYDDYDTSGNELEVTDVSYDPDEKEVTFKFNYKTQYKTDDEGEKDVVVKIYAGEGKKNRVDSVKKYASRKMIVNSKKLKYGYKYKYSISGVRKKGTKKYVTLTGTFRAIK